MAKITQITIVDENTLRLEVDAQKGDEIDLLSLNEFDVSHLRRIIEEGNDKEYQMMSAARLREWLLRTGSLFSNGNK